MEANIDVPPSRKEKNFFYLKIYKEYAYVLEYVPPLNDVHGPLTNLKVVLVSLKHNLILIYTSYSRLTR